MEDFVVIEELNKELFKRTVNEYLSNGYKVINASVTGYSITKYVAFLIQDNSDE